MTETEIPTITSIACEAIKAKHPELKLLSAITETAMRVASLDRQIAELARRLRSEAQQVIDHLEEGRIAPTGTTQSAQRLDAAMAERELGRQQMGQLLHLLADEALAEQMRPAPFHH